MSKTEKIFQINIYRKESDTPIILYDKTNLNENEIIEHLKYVFSSPKIALIKSSSETLIFKPSQIDAIGIIENIDIKKRNKLAIKDNELKEKNNITEKIELEENSMMIENNENKSDQDLQDIEKIDIGNINNINDNSNDNLNDTLKTEDKINE